MLQVLHIEVGLLSVNTAQGKAGKDNFSFTGTQILFVLLIKHTTIHAHCTGAVHMYTGQIEVFSFAPSAGFKGRGPSQIAYLDLKVGNGHKLTVNGRESHCYTAVGKHTEVTRCTCVTSTAVDTCICH